MTTQILVDTTNISLLNSKAIISIGTLRAFSCQTVRKGKGNRFGVVCVVSYD